MDLLRASIYAGVAAASSGCSSASGATAGSPDGDPSASAVAAGSGSVAAGVSLWFVCRCIVIYFSICLCGRVHYEYTLLCAHEYGK
jgi:hypothetical protein